MSHWQLRLIASVFTIATVLHPGHAPAGAAASAAPATTVVGATPGSR